MLSPESPDSDAALQRLASRGEADFSRVEPAVREILEAVRKEGDVALRRFSAIFEKRSGEHVLLRTAFDGERALARLGKAEREALDTAAARIARFHEREREAMALAKGFSYEEEGVRLGLRVRPLARVGVYAPGGKARYPSSVLMSAIPARVAGVKEIVLATPLHGDDSDGSLLAAAYLAGVTEIVDAGGAQAIAALAYGTQTIRRVDKIVGPGNAYVACAKRLVYGAVAIDSIAGPSEILVVADETANPALVAADLLSQAEHDEDAYPLLICASEGFVRAVAGELEKQLETLPRAEIAREALRRNGHAFVIAERAAMARAANTMAPEHLALHVADPEAMFEAIPSAGAAFIGALTPEAAGDYLAGPSHVLPTGGAVRFGSPLGVHDFVARTSIIRYSAESLARDARAICALARLEGLEAHARAVDARVQGLTARVPGRESRP